MSRIKLLKNSGEYIIHPQSVIKIGIIIRRVSVSLPLSQRTGSNILENLLKV